MTAEILSNGAFQDELDLSEPIAKTRSALCKGWTLEFKSHEDIKALKFSPAKDEAGNLGLHIKSKGAKGWVRIYQEIDEANMPFNQSCQFILRGSGEEKDRIASVAILCQGKDGKQVFHTRICEDVAFEAKGSEVKRTVTVAPAVEGVRYFYVLQLTSDIAGITLYRCGMQQKALPAKPASSGGPETGKKLSVGVVAWDMTHNPVGRAYLVADIIAQRHNVELLGASFPKYGSDIWAPIRGVDMTFKTFTAESFRAFVKGAMQMVKENPYDIVHVCKPRLPSLLIGLLYKLYWDIPVIVDVDDYELSFFNTEEGLGYEELITQLGAQDWEEPFSEKWTRFADRMTDIGDSITVSNPTLMDLFGGYIVRHARDEAVFNPALYDQAATREEFGLRPSDKVILFLGTPRPHKGIYQIAEALDTINDPDAVLCIIGTIRDKRVSKEFEKYKNARIVFHDDQPFTRIAELVNMADVVCLLQDPNHPTSQHQIPAKLTDALAMGVPVIATKVPPLRDLIAAKAMIGVDDETFVPELKALLADSRLMRKQGEMGRQYYLTEFSYAVNSARTELAISKAFASKKTIDDKYFLLLQLLQENLMHPIEEKDFARLAKYFRKEAFCFNISKRRGLNIAFFWKQNDSGIYGRRPDMVSKYLAQHDGVNKIAHFDAPIGLKKLYANVQMDDEASFKQGNLVVRNTVERFLHMQDDPNISRFSFLYNDGGGEYFLGRRLPSLQEYPDFVAESLYRAGIYDNTIAWVCPVCFEYPAVHEALNFPFVVADVIDNHLAWDLKPAYAEKVSANYDFILGKANIAFANCDTVQNEMKSRIANIHLVPNGAELFPEDQRWGLPAKLAHIPRPIVGYVGNLSDRVRISLLEKIAKEHPDWSLVLIGSAHLSNDILVLRKHPNVHFLGVVPYEQATSYIANFDCAIIPHEVNEMTHSMNPLKLYVYSSVGVPIVSTALPNMGDLEDSVLVSQNDEEFIANIARVLKNRPKVRPDAKKMKAVSWQARVDAMMKQITKLL